MNKNEKQMQAKARREAIPVRAGRGAGFHTSKKAYDRKPKYKESYR